MSASQRRKGKTGELEVVGILRAHGWPDAERSSRGTTQRFGDIAYGPGDCYFEVRRHERLSVPAAMREVMLAAGSTLIPVLIHRPSRCEWMATLPLSELLPLLKLKET